MSTHFSLIGSLTAARISTSNSAHSPAPYAASPLLRLPSLDQNSSPADPRIMKLFEFSVKFEKDFRPSRHIAGLSPGHPDRNRRASSSPVPRWFPHSGVHRTETHSDTASSTSDLETRCVFNFPPRCAAVCTRLDAASDWHALRGGSPARPMTTTSVAI